METKQREQVCPRCGATYPPYVSRCPDDGSLLQAEAPDPEPDPKTIAGTTIDGRYYVGKLIGQGAMGRVYRGNQLSVGRPVAIKVLRKNISADPTVRKRFLREAKIISEFSHPSTVRLVDFGHTNDLLYIVMEYVEGEPMQRLLGKNKRFSLELSLEIMHQLCGPLIEAHAAEVVHRDLKPDNIFLTKGSDFKLHVKVLDFGIAHVERPRMGVAGNLTQEGVVFGTPQYMSPEQARGERVTEASDLYAMGVMMFEFIAGVLPFDGLTPIDTMIMHVQNAPPRLQDLVPDCPEDVADLVHRLLSKNIEDRPATAREIRQEIEAIRRKHGIWPLGELPAGGLIEHFEAEHLLERDASAPEPDRKPRVTVDGHDSPIAQEPPQEEQPQQALRASHDNPPTSEIERGTLQAPAVRPDEGRKGLLLAFFVGVLLLVALLLVVLMLTM